MNDLHSIEYTNGSNVPMHNEANYLGGKITANGSYKKEISHRISMTWLTVKKLDLLWKHEPIPIKWKIRVFDAVIVNKLIYGLETIPLTEKDCDRLDAFQYRGLRKILKIKHPYWSRVSNAEVLRTANQRAHMIGQKEITTISSKLILKQIKLYAHLIRAPPEDPMKQVSMKEDGTRFQAAFRRVGRPRTKWYTVTRHYVIAELIKQGIIMNNWRHHMRNEELDSIIVEAAIDRII
jgi:hypothetical protein